LVASITRRVVLGRGRTDIHAAYDELSILVPLQRGARGDAAEEALEKERINGKDGKCLFPIAQLLQECGAHTRDLNTWRRVTSIREAAFLLRLLAELAWNSPICPDLGDLKSNRVRVSP
jgi:hypothetical protein